MIVPDTYRDAQLNEHLLTLEQQDEPKESVILADDGEEAAEFCCLGCGEKIKLSYSYCKDCEK